MTPSAVRAHEYAYRKQVDGRIAMDLEVLDREPPNEQATLLRVRGRRDQVAGRNFDGRNFHRKPKFVSQTLRQLDQS